MGPNSVKPHWRAATTEALYEAGSLYAGVGLLSTMLGQKRRPLVNASRAALHNGKRFLHSRVAHSRAATITEFAFLVEAWFLATRASEINESDGVASLIRLRASNPCNSNGDVCS
jgi:hypothetical protein